MLYNVREVVVRDTFGRNSSFWEPLGFDFHNSELLSSPVLLMPGISSQWKGKALLMEELFPKGLSQLILTATFLSSKSEARAGGLSLQSRGDSDIIVTS